MSRFARQCCSPALRRSCCSSASAATADRSSVRLGRPRRSRRSEASRRAHALSEVRIARASCSMRAPGQTCSSSAAMTTMAGQRLSWEAPRPPRCMPPRSPCSSPARPPEGREFPRDILVAIDGSTDSKRGVELAGRVAGAQRLADRARTCFRRSLASSSCARRGLPCAQRGSGCDTGPSRGVRRSRRPDREGRPGERVSLLFIGSRGLDGARRLGSVGERLAHEAPCSVLVSRPL